MQSVRLSKADTRVLGQVFDPEGSLRTAEIVIDPSLPTDPRILDNAVVAKLKSEERAAIALIEAFETSQDKASANKIDTYSRALGVLDAIISEYPNYASARNNRAQLRRWRFGDRNMLYQQNGAIDHERVLATSHIRADLLEAIELASPSRSQHAVSPSQARLLGQAFTQWAALHHAASEDIAKTSSCKVVDSDRQAQKEWFDGEASRLFYLGGLYGNEVAKALAVHTNPHAKLCGNIVQEAMRKEMAQA